MTRPRDVDVVRLAMRVADLEDQVRRLVNAIQQISETTCSPDDARAVNELLFHDDA